MQVKIISQGKPGYIPGVIDVDTGAAIYQVAGISWRWKLDGPVEAAVELVGTDADIECEADVQLVTWPSGRRFRLVPIDDKETT